jgi:hypothetical protein
MRDEVLGAGIPARAAGRYITLSQVQLLPLGPLLEAALLSSDCARRRAAQAERFPELSAPVGAALRA